MKSPWTSPLGFFGSLLGRGHQAPRRLPGGRLQRHGGPGAAAARAAAGLHLRRHGEGGPGGRSMGKP